MTPVRYPLAPSAWGAAVEVPVTAPVQASLFSDFTAARGTAYVEVTLRPEPLSGAWRVRYPGGVLGEISPAQRSRFPSIERVHAAGLQPATLAGIRLDPERGLFDATVFLPHPALAVPRGGVPAGARVLPPGDMYVVDTSTGEFTGPDLLAASPGQWLVGLSVVAGAVVATLDGRVLGSLSHSDSAEIRNIIGPVLDGDPAAPLTARAYALDGMVGLDIAAPEGPCPVVPPLPEIPATVPEPAPEGGPRLTVFPDGSWAVTVERAEAVDPEDVVTPVPGARRIGLPGSVGGPVAPPSGPSLADLVRADTGPAPVPSEGVDFTPTRTWHISAGNYLTEVEKVRLRREARRATEGGRHRLAD